jgi:hypothetical protein
MFRWTLRKGIDTVTNLLAVAALAGGRARRTGGRRTGFGPAARRYCLHHHP